MGVPSRFAVEYPHRALELIRLMEPTARKRDLVGSFGLLAASALLVIPYERMQSRHFLHRRETEWDLAGGLRSLEKTSFLRAPFWRGEHPGLWRQSRIMTEVQNVDRWIDEDGQHPLSDLAVNLIADHTRPASGVLRVLRNALAHGNIIYLDSDFRENAGRRMTHMAFLSRYEESKEQMSASVTYRLVVTSEDEFLRFVQLWAAWIARFADDGAIAEAA